MSDEKHKPWCSERARKENGGCICKASSSLAPARGYASWVIVLNAKREPIVKRCDSQQTEIEMMKAMRKMNPNATVIHAQLNPGDHNELWATSEAHWLAVAEA